MKPTLAYLLILAFAFLKGNDHSHSSTKQMGVNNSAQCCQYNNISNSTNKRSPVDLFATAACCDDDDDDNGTVKRKTGSTVSFLLNDVFEEAFVHSELKRTQKFLDFSNDPSQSVYIFQRELLI